ncbi:MAG: alkaline phosphatase family protein [Solirubrobacteraceae bacterium]
MHKAAHRAVALGAVLSLGVALLAVAGCATRGRPSAVTRLPNPCGRTTTHPTTYKHIIWFTFENASRSAILGSTATDTGYFKRLDSQCGDVRNMHAEQHPSAGNYVAMMSGGTQGITGDPNPKHALTANNLFNEVQVSGGQWRQYSSRMPTDCDMNNYPAAPNSYYTSHHEPAPYFGDIYSHSNGQDCLHWDVALDPGAKGALCQSADRTQCPNTPNGTLEKALTDGTLPEFAYIGPADDGGNSTLGGEVDPKLGNDFLERWMSRIVNSSYWSAGNTAVVITWDEPSPTNSSISSTPIPTIVVAPSVVPGSHTSGTTYYNHYSLLRGVQEKLGLTPLLGKAATANDLASAFNW